MRPTIEQLRDPKFHRDQCQCMFVTLATWKWLEAGYEFDSPFWISKFPIGPVPPGHIEIAMHEDMFIDLRRRQFCGESDNDTIRRIVSAFI